VCARFHQHKPRDLIEVLASVFETLDPEQVDDAPLYNIAPTDAAWILRLDASGDPEPVSVRWGLLPHWARDRRQGVRAINARSETLATRPTFRDAFAERRCLVPVTGFYEWAKGADGRKTPHNISGAEGGPLMLAGLWARNRRVTPNGAPIDTFTIITTPPNSVLGHLHDRMPAVLPIDAWGAWLNPHGAPDALQALLRPFDGPLSVWPVDRKIGNVRLKDDPSVIDPVGPALRQPSLL